MLFALTVLLSVSLLSSIRTLMEQAETPDFLQMHAGTVEEEEISAFAEAHPEVEDWQVRPFLNLENSKISLGEHSLAWTAHRIMDCPCRGRPLTIWSILPMNFPKFGRVRSLSRSVTGRSMNLRPGDIMQIGNRKFTIARVYPRFPDEFHDGVFQAFPGK